MVFTDRTAQKNIVKYIAINIEQVTKSQNVSSFCSQIQINSQNIKQFEFWCPRIMPHSGFIPLNLFDIYHFLDSR